MQIWNKYSSLSRNELLLLLEQYEENLSEINHFFKVNNIPESDEGGKYTIFYRMRLLLEKTAEQHYFQIEEQKQQIEQNQIKLVL